MAISLTTSTPAQGSTDFFINKSLELTFDKAIASSSLTRNVFSLIDIDAGVAVPLSVSAGYADATKVLLLPSSSLKEDTQYRIIVVGTDQGLGYSLVASDADTLTTTIVIEFSTGDSVYSIDQVVQKEAASITLEGDLFLPTNVKALGFDFVVDKVRPKNHKHNIATTLTGDNTVRFTFSTGLYTGDADYTEWVDVNVFPLLSHTGYLASGSTMGAGTIPGYTVSVTGQDLLVTFDTELPNNVGVQIDLLGNIVSTDGASYGGDMKYSINTALYPSVYGVDLIKREVREIVDTFTEDYIGALLFKNTIWVWEKTGRAFNIDSPTFAVQQYVAYATILDLMEDREYYKYVVAGTRRQLGDLGVSIDNIIGRIAMKVAKYQKAKEVAFDSIVPGWQFKIGTSTLAYQEAAEGVSRLWYDINGRYTETMYKYYQDNIPASNVAINRHAKSNNPIW